jgi:hypothetical protein
LATDFAIPFLEVIKQFFCFAGIDRIAHRARQILATQHERQPVALEIQLCKSRLFLSGKASLADGLNLTDSMVGVMNAIAFIYGNAPSP